MAYIKPTFSITAENNDDAKSSPGPFSFTLNLATTPTADASGRLTVDRTIQNTYKTTSSPVQILDGHDVMTLHGSDVWTPGSVGCFLYMKNTDTSGTDSIYVGIVSNCNRNDGTLTGADGATAPAASGDGHLANTDNTTLRTFTLKPGEFAFFPWDYTGDIYVENNAGDPVLEWWLFDRG
tara:strand:- start:2012 stop:2551 length:540 start_codon:yes stop_codon:yes gene_type:complete